MNSDLQELKAALETMRGELDEAKAKLARLGQVVRINEREDGELRANIYCTRMVVKQEVLSGLTAVHIGYQPMGGMVWINRAEGENRRALSLGMNDDGEPQVQLTGPDGKQRVNLFCERDHGTLALLGPDNAAGVVARAHTGGGMVAVLQPDGRARAVLMHHEAEKKEGTDEVQPVTELIFAQPDGKTVLKLRADAGGGLVSAGMPGHADGVVMCMREGQPSLMLRHHEDASSIHLMAGKKMAMLAVRQGWVEPGKASAELMAGDFGSSLVLSEADGTKRVDVSAMQNSGRVILQDEAGREAVALSHISGSHSSLAMQGVAEHDCVRVLASKEVALMRLTSPDNVDTEMTSMVHGNDPKVMLRQDKTPLVMMGHTEHGGVVCAYGRKEVTGGIASLFGGPMSGVVSVSAQDGTALLTLDGTDHGGRLQINNDLGFQRALIVVHEENALLSLNHTGQTGISALASDQGGFLTLHDEEGEVIQTLPNSRDGGADD